RRRHDRLAPDPDDPAILADDDRLEPNPAHPPEIHLGCSGFLDCYVHQTAPCPAAAALRSTSRMNISSSRFTLLRMLSTSMPTAESCANTSFRFCSLVISTSRVWSSVSVVVSELSSLGACRSELRRFSTNTSVFRRRSKLLIRSRSTMRPP